MAEQHSDRGYQQQLQDMEVENQGRKRARDAGNESTDIPPEESASEIKRKPNPDEIGAGGSTIEKVDQIEKPALSLEDLMKAIHEVLRLKRIFDPHRERSLRKLICWPNGFQNPRELLRLQPTPSRRMPTTLNL